MRQREFLTRYPRQGILLAALFILGAHSASGQFVSVRGLNRVAIDQEFALFLNGSGEVGVDGWVVEIPAGWRLNEAAVADRQRMSAIPSTVEGLGGPGKRYRITTRSRVRVGFDLILVLQPGRRLGTVDVKVWPFAVETASGRERIRMLDEQPFIHAVQVGPLVDGGSNRVLQLSREQRSVSIPAARTQTLYEPGAFTVELWLKTSARDVVAVSTWSGDEREAYPLEVMIDLRGRLSWYWGQPGWHQSLTTTDPVADGAWHHVSLVRDADRSVYRLYVDGTPRDSLHATANSPRGAARPLVIGARPRPGSTFERTVPAAGFSGWVDEVRIWNTTRSGTEIRRTMHVPLRSAGGDRWVLGFDSEAALRADGNGAAGIQPADLPLLMPIDDLRARLEEGLVELEWTVDSRSGQTFLVERSRDGLTFEQIGSVLQNAREGTPGRQTYRFVDVEPNGGGAVMTYRIRQLFENGAEQVSGAVKVGLGLAEPKSVLLVGNSPNPFTTRTQITIDVKERRYVRLSVWGISGHPVALLVDRELDPGLHSFLFDAPALPSGLYFCVLDSDEGQQTMKMTLMN